MTILTGKPVLSAVEASHALTVLRRHLLIEGFDVVVDLRRSSGCYLQDARDGRRFLDMFSFVASSALGMNHPKLSTPAFRERLAYASLAKVSNSDIYTVEYAEFVDTFSRIAKPSFMTHLFFIDGGAMGVENALKAAFDWKVQLNFSRGRSDERGHQVVHFRQAFHGRSGYTLSLTNTDPAKTNYFPKFRWPRITNPAITFPLNPENRAAVEKAEAEAVRQIEQAFDNNPGDIAAIIIEPIQGEGGDNHFRPEFFRQLRRIADDREAMLIFDEVQSGIGLTGHMWAYEMTGIRPDMICFGKKTQVCGFMADNRIDSVPANVFKVPSRINSTWGGNLADMVKSRRVLEVIEEESLVDHARRMGDYLSARIEELGQSHPKIISNCRGAGLMRALDLPDKEFRKRFLQRTFELGMLILQCGERSLRFRPPLIVTEIEIDQAVEILHTALRTC